MTIKELDQLAIDYIHSTDSKDQNRLFKKIYTKYEPYIKKRLIGMQKYDSDDVLQIYSIQILTALSKWEQKASFSTFLYSYVRGTIKEWLKTRKMYKDGRYHILLDNIDDFTRDSLTEYCSEDNWGGIN